MARSRRWRAECFGLVGKGRWLFGSIGDVEAGVDWIGVGALSFVVLFAKLGGLGELVEWGSGIVCFCAVIALADFVGIVHITRDFFIIGIFFFVVGVFALVWSCGLSGVSRIVVVDVVGFPIGFVVGLVAVCRARCFFVVYAVCCWLCS